MKINRSFLNSVIINTLTVFVYSVMLQLVVFPFIANRVSSDIFGALLTQFAIANVIGMVLGAALSNLVLKDAIASKAEDVNYSLYNYLFIVFSSLALPGVILISVFFTESNFIIVILLTYCLALRTYLSVEFRVQLNYVAIFWVRMMVVLGYLIGVLLFQQDILTAQPLSVLLLGECLGMAYLYRRSGVVKFEVLNERLNVQQVYRYAGLCISQSSQNAATYGDRLILSKIISFSAVPVFYAAGLTGRLLQMCAETVSGVLLSYLSKYKSEITSKVIFISGISMVFICAMAWVFMQLLSPVIIAKLYSGFYNDSIPIMPWVNGAFAIKIAEIINRPFLIATVPIRFIASFDVFTVIVYLSVCIGAAITYGLIGFSIGFFVVSSVRCAFLFLTMMYFVQSAKRNKKCSSI